MKPVFHCEKISNSAKYAGYDLKWYRYSLKESKLEIWNEQLRINIQKSYARPYVYFRIIKLDHNKSVLQMTRIIEPLTVF